MLLISFVRADSDALVHVVAGEDGVAAHLLHAEPGESAEKTQK